MTPVARTLLDDVDVATMRATLKVRHVFVFPLGGAVADNAVSGAVPVFFNKGDTRTYTVLGVVAVCLQASSSDLTIDVEKCPKATYEGGTWTWTTILSTKMTITAGEFSSNVGTPGVVSVTSAAELDCFRGQLEGAAMGADDITIAMVLEEA